MSRPRAIDLSHAIEDGLITYKGLPAPVVCDFLSRAQSRVQYAAGTEFHIGRIDMVANTGTYVDAPFHRYSDGQDVSELSLSSLVDLPLVRVSSDKRRVTADEFRGLDVAGHAVLVHTEWSRHWNTERYFENHPHLTEDAATALVSGGAAFVGIDSLNIDDTSGATRPVHSVLLGAGIPVCEHMTGLKGLEPGTPYRLHAAPAKVRGLGTFPVRAYAIPVPPSRQFT